jgi:MarR family transcriptional regulator, organic hydroperoxide resistance regulator
MTDPNTVWGAAPAVQTDSGVNPLELERQVCFALAVASRGVISIYRPLLEPMQLTHPQYLVMLALWEHTPRTVTELSELIQLEPATLSPLLKRLETTGYVERRRDPENERALRVTLTEEGVKLRERALQIPPAVMERLQLALSDVENLHGVLTDLIDRTRKPSRSAVPH